MMTISASQMRYPCEIVSYMCLLPAPYFSFDMAHICCRRLYSFSLFCAEKQQRRVAMRFQIFIFDILPPQTRASSPLNHGRRASDSNGNFVSFNSRATRAVWSGDVQQIWFNLLAIHRATFVHSQSIIAAMLTILFYLNLKFQIENRRGKKKELECNKFERWGWKTRSKWSLGKAFFSFEDMRIR